MFECEFHILMIEGVDFFLIYSYAKNFANFSFKFNRKYYEKRFDQILCFIISKYKDQAIFVPQNTKFPKKINFNIVKLLIIVIFKKNLLRN